MRLYQNCLSSLFFLHSFARLQQQRQFIISRNVRSSSFRMIHSTAIQRSSSSSSSSSSPPFFPSSSPSPSPSSPHHTSPPLPPVPNPETSPYFNPNPKPVKFSSRPSPGLIKAVIEYNGAPPPGEIPIPQPVPTHVPVIIKSVPHPSAKPVDIGDTPSVRSEAEAFKIIHRFNDAESPVQLTEWVNAAIKHLDDALVQNPHKLQLPHIYYGLGLCYMRFGEWGACQKFYYKAIEEDKDYVPAYEGMGESYMMQEKWEVSLGWFTKFFDCFPEFYSCYAYYYDLGNYLDSELILSSLLFKRGLCYYKCGELVCASGDFNSVIELDRQHVSASFTYLGRIACDRAKFWDAISLFTKAIQRDTKNFLAYLERSDTWLALGKNEQSDEDRRMYLLLKREKIFTKLKEQGGRGMVAEAIKKQITTEWERERRE